MNHDIPSLHTSRRFRRPCGLLLGLILAVVRGHPSAGADLPKADSAAGRSLKPSFECAEAQTAIERLICVEPSLSALDAAMGAAFRDYRDRSARQAQRDARLVEQRLWLDGRAGACPWTAPPQTSVTADSTRNEVAVACLSRIYEQRVALLGYERNAAGWPRVGFRPTLVEGAGTRLCEDLQRDLVASFLGPGLFVNPLGEREVGFAPVPGLGDEPMVLRADIDAYNLGKPFPVLQWVENKGGPQLPTIEYRAFASSAELLSAIGRGIEPLAHSVRAAARPVIDADRLPRSNPAKPQTRPRAAFARGSILTVDETPRFFRYEDRSYVLGPVQPVPDKPGDLGTTGSTAPLNSTAFACSMPMCRWLV
jgi:uncharacterized protein YecT (DUF1311 family)